MNHLPTDSEAGPGTRGCPSAPTPSRLSAPTSSRPSAPREPSRAWLVGAGLLAVGFAAFSAAAQQQPGGWPLGGASASSTGAEGAEPGEARRAAEGERGRPVPPAGAVDAQLTEVPAKAAHAVVQTAQLPGLQLLHKAKRGADGLFAAPGPDGRPSRLTLHASLQLQMERLLAAAHPEGAALVAVEPKTGRVLALVEYAADGRSEGLATRSSYPAASIFKIITGAALLEHGVSPELETCYHGGLRGIVSGLLQDKPSLDRRCLSLSMALAKSANVVFAKLAVKHLDAAALRSAAERFLFNRPIWAEQQVERSTARIPERRLEFAKSAAGFGDVKLSPLHAALIAAAVGNGGVARNPTLLEPEPGAAPNGSRRLLRAETARTLTEMMKLTISDGTARRSFRERRRNWLGDIEVAGKTGSLANHERPYKDYSWFVGFAPADAPRIAVAAVVVNGSKWKIHAPTVAREALRAYLLGGHGSPPLAARAHASHRRRHR